MARASTTSDAFNAPAERSQRRHLDQVPSQGVWTHSGGASQGRQPGLESYQRAHQSSRRSQSKVGGAMCPACIASAGVVAGSVVSTGGITALVMKVLRKKKGGKNYLKEKE